jgi:molybdopterin synthase catalytic subunit
MRVEILTRPFKPYSEVDAFEAAMARQGRHGATAVFVGTMRSFNDGRTVDSMLLEHYPEMTERHLRAICEEAERRWKVMDILLLHRAGEVHVGEAIVLVAVWAAHRGDAADACRFIIEDLKARAPFWKKEKSGDSARWVEHNTSGYAETPPGAGRTRQ